MNTIIPRASASKQPVQDLHIPGMPRRIFEHLLARFGTPAVMAQVTFDPNWVRHVNDMEFIHRLNICTLVLQPLDPQGELLGYLAAAAIGEPSPPDEDDLRLIADLSVHARIAVTNAQMFQEMEASRARLRALSDRLIEVREDERRSLAVEIHEGLGQALTALSLSVDAAERGLQIHAPSPSNGNSLVNAEHASALRQQIGWLLQKVRDLSQDLRPSVLDELGLFPALVDYCERFSRQTGIDVHLRQNGALCRFSPRIETTVFRLAQEAMNNIAHHTLVKNADLLLWAGDDLLGLKVEEHNPGFDLQDAPDVSGMEEQAGLCGGRLEIESIAGQGMILILEIPLSDQYRW
jgi:signal transduction histidine kinase